MKQNVSRPGEDFPTATSDAQGRFTLAIPHQHRHSSVLYVQAPGYMDRMEELQRFGPPGQAEATSRTVIMYRPARLAGSVADENGEPLPGVKVTAYPAEIVSYNTFIQMLEETATDGDGRFELEEVPQSPLMLRLAAPGYATTYVPAEPGNPVAASLSRGATVRGQAVTMDGQPVGDIPLILNRPTRNAQPHEAQGPQPLPQQWSETVTTGESGAFSFRHVPPGEFHLSIPLTADKEKTHDVRVEASNYMRVTVPENGDPEPITVPVFDGYTVEGQVVEKGTTAPISGARIWLTHYTNPDPWTTSDEAGRFTFQKIFNRASVTLTAEAEGYLLEPNRGQWNSQTTQTVQVDMPASGTVIHATLPMVRQQTVNVRVIDAQTSQPLPGARVNAMTAAEGERAGDVISDADGRAVLRVLPAPAMRAAAFLDGYAPSFSDPLPAQISPDREVVVQMRRGLSISGVVLDPDGKPFADGKIQGTYQYDWADAVTGHPHHSTNHSIVDTGDDGRFNLGNLPAGTTITVYASADEFAPSEPARVLLREGEDVTTASLRLRIAKHLAGRLLDTDGKPVISGNVAVTSKETAGGGLAHVSQDGLYRINNLPDAPVDVTIMRHHPSYQIEFFYDVEVGRDGVDFQFGKGETPEQRMERERRK